MRTNQKEKKKRPKHQRQTYNEGSFLNKKIKNYQKKKKSSGWKFSKIKEINHGSNMSQIPHIGKSKEEMEEGKKKKKKYKET